MATELHERKLNWTPPMKDARDKKLSLVVSRAEELPANVDLSGIYLKDLGALFDYPDVYDQQEEGSCTGNTGGGVIDIHLKKSRYPWRHTPSRQFIYYNTRVIEGSPADEDTGATIRGTFKSIATYGACPEDGNPKWSWPYESLKNFAIKPPEECYKDALLHVALTYEQVPQTEDAIKSVLAAGIPIAFGFMVHESFMTKKVAESGVMPKPAKFFDNILGGHAIVAVGYLTDYEAGDQGIKNWIICRNSWGKEWGKDGHFLMPMKEMFLKKSQCSDFWCVHSVGFKKA